MSQKSVQPQDKYVLRLPDGMRDRIKAAADANGRSMNAEIILTLNEKYPPEVSFDDLAAEISGLVEEMRASNYGHDPFRALRKSLDEIHLALEDHYERMKLRDEDRPDPRDDE